MNEVLSFQTIVKPEHLNAANTLFGGTLVAWIDEAAAHYAACQMQTRRIVTLKITEMVFKQPVHQADTLQFLCSTKKIGRTSFTLNCRVVTKAIEVGDVSNEIAHCELIFVAVDESGKPKLFMPRPETRQ